jgi:hypothetical protein
LTLCQDWLTRGKFRVRFRKSQAAKLSLLLLLLLLLVVQAGP